MHEDKLSHDERRRLEALNQAIASCGMIKSTEEVLACAKKFERFIIDGTVTADLKPGRMQS